MSPPTVSESLVEGAALTWFAGMVLENCGVTTTVTSVCTNVIRPGARWYVRNPRCPSTRA